MAQTSPTRPVLRYHGGKWQLAPWIIENFPPHRVYVEAYGGAASVLMRKPRAYAEVYNDTNGEIVNVFRVLRDPAQARELERLLRLTPFAREEFEMSYLLASDPIEQARRTILRTFAGFGSAAFNRNRMTGFRYSTTPSHTTPVSEWTNYPDHIRTFCERLRGVVVENKPALDVIAEHDSRSTLVYCDPPYVHETRQQGQCKNYGNYEMTDDDHRELANVLHNVQSMVVISGYDCELYQQLYGDWLKVEHKAYADGARPRIECLWISPSAEAARLPLLNLTDDGFCKLADAKYDMNLD